MSEFEEILRRWERRGPGEGRHPMERALDRYPPKKGEKERSAEARESRGRQKPAGKRLPLSETVDLHGMRVEEALSFLDGVIRRNAGRNGSRRILVIHGKGLHSSTGARLRDAVRAYLREHPLVGETGVPPARDGGDGAVWAVCRYRSR